MGWQKNQSHAAFIFLLVSALLTVFYKLGDAYIVTHLIISSSALIGTFTYLILGSTVGLIIYFIFCQSRLGKLVDNNFSTIKNISPKAKMMAMFSGMIGAICTAIYLWSFRSLDPSIVVPISTLMIVYVAVAESFLGRIKFGKVLPSLFFVLSGVTIASFRESVGSQNALGAVLIMVFVYNLLAALAELVMKGGVDRSDAVSFGFWRFFWLCISSYVLTFGYAIFSGNLNFLYITLWQSLGALPYITMVMTVVFFALGWANRGLALSNATIKNIVLSMPTVLTVIVIASINHFFPGFYSQVNASMTLWFLRFVGAISIMWGVMRLSW